MHSILKLKRVSSRILELYWNLKEDITHFLYYEEADICIIIFKLVTNFEEEPDAEFLESPMADGTIEEDFEAALARGRGGADAMNDRGDASSGMLRNGPENDQKSIQPLDFSGKPI